VLTVMDLSRESLRELFEVRWLAANGEIVHPSQGGVSFKAIADYVLREGLTPVALSSRLEVEFESRLAVLGVPVIETSQGEGLESTAGRIARAACGITLVDGLIAETGTLICTSVGPGDRLVGSLPPVHLAIASGAPLYPDLAAYLETADSHLSYTLITGPSRTADIEKQLVLGAHGPLRVILWNPW